MSTKKIVVSVLAGIATGALIGVLFAPEKGTDTRKKISKKSSDSVNDLKKKFDKLIKKTSDKFENEKEQLANAYDRVKSKVEELAKEAKKA